ncbi:DUF4153 domain-containing protein [Herbaspirillum lusitanum]|uniref:DUF4153 domain-containing protein n=1 Tax=Herbaspirillum lusitanum TaxID=213312 RepID=A0ABW9AFC0_9BURK
MSSIAHPDSHDSAESLRNAVSLQTSRMRVLLGLLQGLSLYLLYFSWAEKAWPATSPQLFVPLTMLALFLPPVLITASGHLSRRNLLLWGVGLALLLLALGGYDAWRNSLNIDALLSDIAQAAAPGNDDGGRRFPSPALVGFSAIGLFIAQAMLLAGDAERKRIASYGSYFEFAWKLMVQLLFATLFTGLMWAVLYISEALFSLIRLRQIGELLGKSWFNIPVTTLAFSFALHLSDARPQIVAGIRRLLLTLLSWLLPLATLVICGFLASIVATGLQPLWGTGHASYVLLGATAMLILLINTVFQDGRQLAPMQKFSATETNGAAPHTNRLLRLCCALACLLPLPLVAIAAYSMSLRVADYGWSVSRIAGATCILIAAMYAVGYALAALRRAQHLRLIATTNIATSLLILLALAGLFSPLLDPARIAVNSQLRRLANTATEVSRFDFTFLRFDSARFGRQALLALAQNKDSGDARSDSIRSEALKLLRTRQRWESPDRHQTRLTAAELRAGIRVHPQQRSLPDDFLNQDWNASERRWQLPPCLISRGRQCDAYFIRPEAGAAEQLLMTDTLSAPTLMARSSTGQWEYQGRLAVRGTCREELLRAAAEGSLQWQPPPQRDAIINGARVTVQRLGEDVSECPKPAAAK